MERPVVGEWGVGREVMDGGGLIEDSSLGIELSNMTFLMRSFKDIII